MVSVFDILKSPVVTEKTTDLKSKQRQVVFEVVKSAGKDQIKRAVETQFGVKVDSVRTCIYRGKTKRVGKSIGRMGNWKKAIVKINSESDIDAFGIFDTVAPAAVSE